jgi:hypothetical protein
MVIPLLLRERTVEDHEQHAIFHLGAERLEVRVDRRELAAHHVIAGIPIERERVREVIHVRPLVFLVEDHLAVGLPHDVRMLRIDGRGLAVDLGVQHETILALLFHLEGVARRARLVIRVARGILRAIRGDEVFADEHLRRHHDGIEGHGLIHGHHRRLDELLEAHG